MALTAAQLLDELMGKDRNLVPGEKSAQVPWDHPDVCRSYLCGFCPHDLFVNTKADLGTCSKIHDDQLKTDYEKSSRYGRMGFEEEFLHYLSNIQADVDRKIRRGHERLMISQEREQAMAEKDTDKTKMLTDHINQLLEQIEELGSEGKVEEAQGIAKLVDQLKDEREQSKQNHSGVASQEKQMEVCEVCGAFLIVGDAQSRVDDHLQGKQHVGYAKIKSTLEDMKSRPWEKKRELERKESERKDSERKDSERKSKDDKDKERRRDRSSEKKSRRSRSRSRERRRDRSRERRRDRSRERRRDRSRSRDRERSDRDRDRRRDSRRSSRRSRSRSRDRRRRSRSRDRDEKRSRHSSRDRDRDRKERYSKDGEGKRESKGEINKDQRDETKLSGSGMANGDVNAEELKEKGINENSSIMTEAKEGNMETTQNGEEQNADEEIAMNY